MVKFIFGMGKRKYAFQTKRNYTTILLKYARNISPAYCNLTNTTEREKNTNKDL